jgi:adenylyltransferase/sulfurtransferase
MRTHETYVINLSADSNIGDAPVSKTDFRNREYDAACTIEFVEVEEIDATQFHLLRQQQDAVVIDVRERGETPLVTTLPHRQIPMSQFSRALAGIEEETILLFCQHGIRSVYAAELLQEHFGSRRKVFSLKGGVAKWGVDLGAE